MLKLIQISIEHQSSSVSINSTIQHQLWLFLLIFMSNLTHIVLSQLLFFRNYQQSAWDWWHTHFTAPACITCRTTALVGVDFIQTSTKHTGVTSTFVDICTKHKERVHSICRDLHELQSFPEKWYGLIAVLHNTKTWSDVFPFDSIPPKFASHYLYCVLVHSFNNHYFKFQSYSKKLYEFMANHKVIMSCFFFFSFSCWQNTCQI